MSEVCGGDVLRAIEFCESNERKCICGAEAKNELLLRVPQTSFNRKMFSLPIWSSHPNRRCPWGTRPLILGPVTWLEDQKDPLFVRVQYHHGGHGTVHLVWQGTGKVFTEEANGRPQLVENVLWEFVQYHYNPVPSIGIRKFDAIQPGSKVLIVGRRAGGRSTLLRELISTYPKPGLHIVAVAPHEGPFWAAGGFKCFSPEDPIPPDTRFIIFDDINFHAFESKILLHWLQKPDVTMLVVANDLPPDWLAEEGVMFNMIIGMKPAAQEVLKRLWAQYVKGPIDLKSFTDWYLDHTDLYGFLAFGPAVDGFLESGPRERASDIKLRHASISAGSAILNSANTCASAPCNESAARSSSSATH